MWVLPLLFPMDTYWRASGLSPQTSCPSLLNSLDRSHLFSILLMQMILRSESPVPSCPRAPTMSPTAYSNLHWNLHSGFSYPKLNSWFPQPHLPYTQACFLVVLHHCKWIISLKMELDTILFMPAFLTSNPSANLLFLYSKCMPNPTTFHCVHHSPLSPGCWHLSPRLLYQPLNWSLCIHIMCLQSILHTTTSDHFLRNK